MFKLFVRQQSPEFCPQTVDWRLPIALWIRVNDDCFNDHKKWFTTLDWGSVLICIFFWCIDFFSWNKEHCCITCTFCRSFDRSAFDKSQSYSWAQRRALDSLFGCVDFFFIHTSFAGNTEHYSITSAVYSHTKTHLHIHICIYIYRYVYTHICICMCVYVCVYIVICLYMWFLCVRINTFIHANMYMYKCICIYVYVYIYI